MADKKISALTALIQANVDTTADVLPIVDTNATETKKVTPAALVGAAAAAGLTNVDINSGAIDGTTIGANSAAAGTFTTLTGTTKVVSPFLDAVGSAGGQLRNASGTSQLAWGAGGGSNLSLEVATNINPANAAVSIAPTGTGTVTINPATAGTMNNVAIGGSTAAAGSFTTLTTSSTVTLNGGTANGVLYLNGSKVATSGSALTFDGTNLAPDGTSRNLGTASLRWGTVYATSLSDGSDQFVGSAGTTVRLGFGSSWTAQAFAISGSEQMRLTSTGLGIGTSSPDNKLEVTVGDNAGINIEQSGANQTGYLNFRDSDGALQGRISYDHSNDSLRFATSNNEKLRITSTGNVGIGTSSPAELLQVAGNIHVSGGDRSIFNRSNNFLSFGTNNTERARITSGGNFGIANVAPDYNLSVGTPGTTANSYIQLASTTTGTGNIFFGDTTGTGSGSFSGYIQYDHNINALIFGSSATERARITSGGELLVAKTTTDVTSVGIILTVDGRVLATTNNADCLVCNRQVSDGTLVEFRHENITEGTISVSGNTVSYNAFAGSHWSQLQDGSKPDILRGTVMESINELCVWPDENNERLPKAKISDTAGSKKVYGVFMAWDNDWTDTNDMYVTAVGAFICRVNGSVTVQEGDLLESNGDGTARVQADDLIRSSTIGKVTSTVKTHEYDDGSYCVPTVLYCG